MKKQEVIDEMEYGREWLWTSLRSLMWAERAGEDYEEEVQICALLFCYSAYTCMSPVLCEV